MCFRTPLHPILGKLSFYRCSRRQLSSFVVRTRSVVYWPMWIVVRSLSLLSVCNHIRIPKLTFLNDDLVYRDHLGKWPVSSLGLVSFLSSVKRLQSSGGTFEILLVEEINRWICPHGKSNSDCLLSQRHGSIVSTVSVEHATAPRAVGAPRSKGSPATLV